MLGRRKISLNAHKNQNVYGPFVQVPATYFITKCHTKSSPTIYLSMPTEVWLLDRLLQIKC